MNDGFHSIVVLVLLLICTGNPLADGNMIETEGGARYRDLAIGSGEIAEPGDLATMHYVGWLDDNGNKGRQFINSYGESNAIKFVIGTDRVMPGWNEGIVGMMPGGKRLLFLPSSLGLGSRSMEGIIPANASLIFLIELIELRKTP
jgi:FKBP-type peptidyl-prolyl cis-trans isomerase